MIETAVRLAVESLSQAGANFYRGFQDITGFFKRGVYRKGDISQRCPLARALLRLAGGKRMLLSRVV